MMMRAGVLRAARPVLMRGRGLSAAVDAAPGATVVRENRFKAALHPQSGEPKQIGCWTGLSSTLVAEMVSHVSGFDWFVIDMEHSPNELKDVLLQLQVSQYGHSEPIVRVPWNEPVTVKRVLDLGAQTLLFPYIQTAEEAAAAVAATRYPGTGAPGSDGVRGVMSLARMNNYGAQIPHYYGEAAGQLCNIMQVETIEALERIPEIARVPGVDALFVGPSDLAASMGHLGNPGHPEVKDAIARGFDLIHQAGKPGGYLSGDPAECKRVLAMEGCRFCGVGSDMAFLTSVSRAKAAEFKGFAASLST